MKFWVHKDLRQKTLPFPGWTPHAGRHAWDCYQLLDRLEDELARLSIEAEFARGAVHRPAVEWTTRVGSTLVDTHIRPLMGHISLETTEVYLRAMSAQNSTRATGGAGSKPTKRRPRMNKYDIFKEDATFAEHSEAPFSGANALTKIARIDTNPLTWTVVHKDGGEFDVSLERLRDGDAEAGIIGRPQLIYELAPDFRTWSQGRVEGIVKNQLAALTKFFRFLTIFRSQWNQDIPSCLDVETAHGEAYLLQQPGRN